MNCCTQIDPYGKQIHDVFTDVPTKYFIDSLVYGIKDSKQGIIHDPVYYILNLCRVLYFLRCKKITSKLEGGNWGLEYLPQKYSQLLISAIDSYQNRCRIAEWN